MPPALFVELDTRARWRPRGIIQVTRVTAHARHSGGATAAGVVAVPRSLRMALADPAAILAKIAFHVHRDRKARGERPRERAADGSQRPLNPNSKFFRDKMPALGKTKLSVIHSFCGFRKNTVLPSGAGQTPTRVKAEGVSNFRPSAPAAVSS